MRFAISFAAACICSSIAFADDPDGKAIYQKMCARCHGKSGEGTKDAPNKLVGNRSLPQLEKYIAKRMPEDAPGTCVGKDAEAVAEFIFDAFYSPAAQARIKAPRIELARLTVNEYRYAIADLVTPLPSLPLAGRASDGEPRKPSLARPANGLKGEYFTFDAKRKRTQAIKRIDPVVKFDLGPDGPDHEKLKTPEISANWQGSVVALDTGWYDFIVRNEHSVVLWVNDLKTPLIDKKIKSGTETEFRGAIFLLGGRAYPLKLEFSRSSVGVRKDPKEKLIKEKTTIALEWKPPGRADEIIPERNLSPEMVGTTFALSIPLPPDDRSAGYERGNAVSKAWVQASVDGAIETANYVAARLPELAGTRTDDVKLKDYCARFAERAFRRPLTPEQKKLYIEQQFAAAKDPETAVKRVVLLVLQSPRFLYREPPDVSRSGDRDTTRGVVPRSPDRGTQGDAFDVASRISFMLWDTLPDQELLKAATTGKLKTRADVVREAERMIADRRARDKMRGFFLRWLKLDQVAELPKDAKKFPDFNASVVSDLRTSLELFCDDVMWSEKSDFRRLLLDDHLYLNARLAKLYGGEIEEDDKFEKVTPKPGERFGVLTHPYVLATYSYTGTTSPIHRGVFLARNLLGVALRPPADAFTPLAPELHPKLNTRERIALQTSPKNCQSCHGIINPLGFTLEHFDAIGRFRSEENGKPIDASGLFVTRSGDTVKFKNEAEIAKFLASSDEAHEAFTARLFHYLVRQPVLAYGPDKLNELRRSFAEHDFNMRKLAVEIVAQAALPERSVN